MRSVCRSSLRGSRTRRSGSCSGTSVRAWDRAFTSVDPCRCGSWMHWFPRAALQVRLARPPAECGQPGEVTFGVVGDAAGIRGVHELGRIRDMVAADEVAELVLDHGTVFVRTVGFCQCPGELLDVELDLPRDV